MSFSHFDKRQQIFIVLYAIFLSLNACNAIKCTQSHGLTDECPEGYDYCGYIMCKTRSNVQTKAVYGCFTSASVRTSICSSAYAYMYGAKDNVFQCPAMMFLSMAASFKSALLSDQPGAITDVSHMGLQPNGYIECRFCNSDDFCAENDPETSTKAVTETSVESVNTTSISTPACKTITDRKCAVGNRLVIDNEIFFQFICCETIKCHQSHGLPNTDECPAGYDYCGYIMCKTRSNVQTKAVYGCFTSASVRTSICSSAYGYMYGAKDNVFQCPAMMFLSIASSFKRALPGGTTDVSHMGLQPNGYIECRFCNSDDFCAENDPETSTKAAATTTKATTESSTPTPACKDITERKVCRQTSGCAWIKNPPGRGWCEAAVTSTTESSTTAVTDETSTSTTKAAATVTYGQCSDYTDADSCLEREIAACFWSPRTWHSPAMCLPIVPGNTTETTTANAVDCKAITERKVCRRTSGCAWLKYPRREVAFCDSV